MPRILPFGKLDLLLVILEPFHAFTTFLESIAFERKLGERGREPGRAVEMG
jgi:hypothetical protein